MFTSKHHAALLGWRITRLPSIPQRRRLSSHSPFPPLTFSNSGYAKLVSDPLRILFCGSDAFSTPSLRALHSLQTSHPSLVESVDVLVRPGKPVGRGLKQVKHSACYHLARELDLPIHERDTFTGWELPPCRPVPKNHGASSKSRPPQHFNLIIAVSFGLFVPPRILNAVKYGGLNLHPSLLPDLSGPAPLQWTILANRPVTGVTLQTLHPAAYDRGVILAQTPAPGIPVPDDATAGSLLSTLAEEGAKLLVDGLTHEVHVPPYENRGGWWSPSPSTSDTAEIVFRDAPKLTTHQAHIDWRCRFWGADKTLYPTGRLSAGDIARAYRALTWGPQQDGRKASGIRTHALLNATAAGNAQRRRPAGDQTKRVILTDIEPVPCPPVLRDIVQTIVQVRRSVLLMSGQAEEEKFDKEEEEDNGHGSSGPGGLSPKDALSEALMIWDEANRDLSGIGSITLTMPDDPQSNITHEIVRLPVLVDQKSGTVTIPIGVPYRMVNGEIFATVDDGHPLDALRINSAKVEGHDTKAAAQALRRFIDMPLGPNEVQRDEYAIDVMTRRLD